MFNEMTTYIRKVNDANTAKNLAIMKNYIWYDESYKPTTKDKFKVYLEHLLHEDQEFPTTINILERVDRDRRESKL